MKPKTYYKKVALAIASARDWAGTMHPEDAREHCISCDRLLAETAKRLKRCK